jgi:Ca2+-binding RTX toxin-like protein
MNTTVNHSWPDDNRAARPTRLAATAVLAAVIAGGWLAAGPADAAAASQHRHGNFKTPTLRHGTLAISGTQAADRIALRLKAGRPEILQIDVNDDGAADFSVRRKFVARIVVDARFGDDLVRIDDANGAFTDVIPTTIDGGFGSDTLAGGAGAERLRGGFGNDSIDGNRGNDLALMGAGDDTFVWDPGDGSDTLEGQTGTDTMRFNGAGAAERVDLSANGNRLRFFRDVANVTMDTNDVETVDFKALGGADTVTVNDLSGTDVRSVGADLAGTPGGTTGDAQPDRVIVNGTNGNDAIGVGGDAAGVIVAGLPAQVAIQRQEPADALVVNGLGGNDAISAAALAADAIALTLDGGAGSDGLAGGRGVETLLGGDGNDSFDGNAGNDAALMGAGDDTFVWDPGDGSDTLEGQTGTDTMRFNGAGASENINLAANGNRLRFFRDVANITMDTNDVETVAFNALGGADTITVNDLTGTDVGSVQLDLAGTPEGTTGDAQPDRVIVNGTNGNDAIVAAGSNGAASVTGLAATVSIVNAEPANDTLAINALAGNDVVDASALQASAIKLAFDGGTGDDILIQN